MIFTRLLVNLVSVPMNAGLVSVMAKADIKVSSKSLLCIGTNFPFGLILM